MTQKFGDYIIYVDESGDHSLESIDPQFPVFVLAFCIFNKQTYSNDITTDLQLFKFRHFGHDMVVLHEHEIRKAKNDFKMLVNVKIREPFMNDLNDFIANSRFSIVSVAIKKIPLKEKYTNPHNPYHLALQYGLERVYSFLKTDIFDQLKTHVVFER